MNFNAFHNRCIAILALGRYLPTELQSWSISDLDEFFQNLDLWANPESPWIESLFSPRILGIRQNIADVDHRNVGLKGECLFDDELRAMIKQKYLERGYDVIELKQDGTWQFSECTTDRVRIALRTLD